MKVGIVGAASGAYVQELLEAAPASNQVWVLPFSRLAARLGSGDPVVLDSQVCVTGLDALIVRSMPPGSLEQVILRMDILHACQAAGLHVVNSPAALEAAIDKFLALHRLAQAGLLVPPTFVCQTLEQAMEAYEELGPDVVMKPLFGSEGRGLMRMSHPDLAVRAFSVITRLSGVVYLQPYIPHEGRDWRVLIAGDNVLGMERRQVSGWRTNLGQGGRPYRLSVGGELERIARRAAQAVGARWAGVDVLPARDGHWYVLEVNAVPGWRGLAEVTGVDIPRMLWRDLHQLMGNTTG